MNPNRDLLHDKSVFSTDQDDLHVGTVVGTVVGVVGGVVVVVIITIIVIIVRLKVKYIFFVLI